MTLAPLPYLLILLLRRRAFFDWFFAGMLTVLLGYLAFAILSENPAVLQHSDSLLLLCRAWPLDCLSGCGSGRAPLEIDRLPSARGCGGASSLRIHAACLGDEPADELGIYARRRRIFLFD